MDESELIKKRFKELITRSASHGYFIFSDFLGLNEQSLLFDAVREAGPVKFTAFGGAEGVERVMIRFGDEEELGYSDPFPITTIKIAPKSQKFADKLSHRDFLGALMNLGIERATLGDIVIKDNVGYLFAKNEIADFICGELKKVRNTDVTSTPCDFLPDAPLYSTRRVKVMAVGERLDAVVAKVFSISREESLLYFKRGLVFANGRLIENNSYIPKKNEKISVRGLGRFIYLSYETTSKKGKLNIEVDLYE